jgi:hypothetical protein
MDRKLEHKGHDLRGQEGFTLLELMSVLVDTRRFILSSHP